MPHDRPEAAGGLDRTSSPPRDYLLPHLTSLPLHRALLRSVEARLLARYRFERPVLDVGCGDGHFASILFPEGVDAGIDPSPRAVEEARSRGVYREVKVADACALPYPDGSYASVFSNCTLEHITNLDGALDEIARVLRPGGLFVATVPSPNYERFLLGSTLLSAVGLRPLADLYGRWMTRISYHHHYYSPEEWNRRLAARGLAVREWEYYFSPSAHRVFDLSHYISAHSLLVRKLTGRWILFPGKPGVRLQRALLGRYYTEKAAGEGAYILLVCTKTLGGHHPFSKEPTRG
ncbi:MAG: class I SAM-dependent DNA methyltransferase [Sphingomonadaceae bacterium]